MNLIRSLRHRPWFGLACGDRDNPIGQTVVKKLSLAELLGLLIHREMDLQTVQVTEIEDDEQ